MLKILILILKAFIIVELLFVFFLFMYSALYIEGEMVSGIFNLGCIIIILSLLLVWFLLETVYKHIRNTYLVYPFLSIVLIIVLIPLWIILVVYRVI